MKRCPVCGQTYSDANINFCLNDGELLSRLVDETNDDPPPTVFADDSPPTLLMNAARITNQTNWQSAQPPAPWQNNQMLVPQYGGLPSYLQPKSHTLPTVGLILGISSIIFVCCFGGIWLGIPAAVLGLLGLRNADNFPDRFGGRGMAIAAMAIGAITFIFSMIHILVAILAD